MGLDQKVGDSQPWEFLYHLTMVGVPNQLQGVLQYPKKQCSIKFPFINENPETFAFHMDSSCSGVTIGLQKACLVQMPSRGKPISNTICARVATSLTKPAQCKCIKRENQATQTTVTNPLDATNQVDTQTDIHTGSFNLRTH